MRRSTYKPNITIILDLGQASYFKVSGRGEAFDTDQDVLTQKQ
jgi:hypothetical protein